MNVYIENYNYFTIVSKLMTVGFKLYKEINGNLEIWYNPETGRKFIIEKESKNISHPAFEIILAQAGLSLEEFNKI